MNERQHIVVSLLNSHFIIPTFEILPTSKRFSLSSTVNPCFPSHSQFLFSTTKMAKSSSNTDPCGRVIQIIEALLATQHITYVLIPRENTQSFSSSTSTSPRCGLDPSFSSFLEELSSIFPYHSQFASSYQRKRMKWGEWDTFSTSVTWYKTSDSWST
jgi:hypothetical protein